MDQKKEFYVGIDIGRDRAMISLYREDQKEPETISTVRGMEKFGIPLVMFLEKKGTTYYGDEALKRKEQPNGDFFEDIYEGALQEQTEETTLYHGLFVQFVRRLIRLKERYGLKGDPTCVAITVPVLSQQAIALLQYVRQELDFSEKELIFMDYAESFFLHTYHQEAVLWQHDVAMFYFQGAELSFYLLHRKSGLKVQFVTAEQKHWQVPESICTHAELMDEYFSNVVRESFAKHAISTVYFVGDGFDGNWLRESLRVMGTNKRGFLGKNLLTRGAAYGAWRYSKPETWGFFFNCEYKMQGELDLRIESQGADGFIRLIEAGQNWFCQTPSFKLLYGGTPEIVLKISRIGAANSQVLHLELTDLPDRPEAALRFRIQAIPKNGTEVTLRLSDDGFGEFFKSSGRIWEFPVALDMEGGSTVEKARYGQKKGGR